MVFGSSVGSAVESMADKFVESIYAGIEDLAAGKGDRVEMIGHINTLMGSNVIPGNASIEQMMKITLLMILLLVWKTRKELNF